MSGELREVLNYPNWMWIIGVLLLALVLVWVGVWLIRWLRSNRSQEQNQIALIPLDEKRRQRYLGFIDEVEGRLNTGDLDERGVHLAVAGILRALGTERTGRDLETATVSEIRKLIPTWPDLADALSACEDSFKADSEANGEETQFDPAFVMDYAREVWVPHRRRPGCYCRRCSVWLVACRSASSCKRTSRLGGQYRLCT